MPLEEYREKRDFDHTPEPTGGAAAGPGAPLRFVVQKHHARALHYDFRLELDGVLMSWAIPKGPSFDPKDKRLAVHVEDHPLDYAGFEGTIPAGEYGGGTVIVWDRGTWEPISAKPDSPPDAHAGLAKGDFKFRLHGDKLIGNWVLVRLKPGSGEKRENWLLIKERDEHARPAAEYDVLTERPESAATGRTIEQVAAEAEPEGGDPEKPEPTGAAPPPQPLATALSAPPDLALCKLVSEPPTGSDWLVEVKYDGYRATAALESGHARVFERSGGDATARFAHVARAIESLPADDALLDGEMVVFDEGGISRFGLLTDALTHDPERITFVVFDLLHLNGYDLRPLPTTQRRELLHTLLDAQPDDGALRIATHVAGDAPAFFEAACAQGLEGIVCKRADAPYPTGRTGAWVKAKCRREQEFVVLGATEPAGTRQGFGALLLGYHDASGALTYAGRVGSGFSDAEIEAMMLRLERLEVADSPLSSMPDTGGRAARWVRPELVVQVAFAEWTGEGLLRQPSFLRVRDDVSADAIVREESGPVEPAPAAVSDTPPTRPRHDVRISNPDKRLFPGSELTKRELADYYEAVSEVMLAEVGDRPLTLVRCPVGDGKGTCFYQRHPDRGLASAVHVLSHTLPGHDAADEWLWVDSVAGLVSLAQMGCAEVHTWLSRTDAPGRPDRLVFDLDPGPDVAWPQIAGAARALRTELESLGLTAYLKSTGSKGLHVVAPIEPVWEFARVHELARSVAERVAARDTGSLTTSIAKNKRNGRIFIDYVRNSEGASAVAAYSTRFNDGPSVALPLAWDELTDDLDIRAFTPAVVIERVAARIDPWRDIDDAAVGAKVLRAAAGMLPETP